MNPDVQKYVMFVLRRIWLALIAAAILGGAGFWFFNSQETTYRAQTEIFIGNSLSPDPERNDVLTGLLLVPTYEEFAENTNVLQATIDNLELDMSLRDIRDAISTRNPQETPILQIRATTTDRELSAAIANEVARQVIAQSPSNLTDDQLEQMDILQQQINEQEEQINNTTEQYNVALQQLNIAIENGNQDEIRDRRDRFNEIAQQLDLSRSTLSQIQLNFLSLSNQVGRLDVIEEAIDATLVGTFSPIIIGALGALVGFGGVAGVILLFFEYIDHKFRTESEIIRDLGLPVFGVIKNTGKVRRNHQKLLTENLLSEEQIAEGYRTIQANMLFSSNNSISKSKSYIITSPSTKEGRSFTAANLAATIAEGGLKVLLVDTDMRNSTIHELFSLSNEKGFVSLVKETCKDIECFQEALEGSIQHTALPSLHVITSGNDGHTLSVQALGYEQVSLCMEHLQNSTDYNVIIFDTSAALVAADGYIIAATTQANVLLLAQSAQTNRDQMIKIRDQFDNVGGNVQGVILNKV